MAEITTAQVTEVMPLTNSIIKLLLAPEIYVDYQAGQYLEIFVDEQWQAYSIANAPLGARHYELHIRHEESNPYNEPLFQQIKNAGTLTIRLPAGACTLATVQKDSPLLFIAGGTGLAPVKAMIEELLATDDQRDFSFWWAVRNQSDLYFHEQLQIWQKHVPHFQYHHYLANENAQPMIAKIAKSLANTISRYQIILAGPFPLVYQSRDKLLGYGVAREAMYSDAFSFEE